VYHTHIQYHATTNLDRVWVRVMVRLVRVFPVRALQRQLGVPVNSSHGELVTGDEFTVAFFHFCDDFTV